MKQLRTVLVLLLCLCMLPLNALAYTVDPAGGTHQATVYTPAESGLYAVTVQKDGKTLSPLPVKPESGAIYDPALTVSVKAGDAQAQEVDYNVFWLVKGTRYTVQLENISGGAYDDSGEWNVSVAKVEPTAVAANADTWVEGEWFAFTPDADDTYTVSAASKPVFVEILTADAAALASGAWSTYALDKEKCRVGMELDYLRSLKAAIALRDEEIDLAEDAYEKALAKLDNYNSLNQLANDTDMLDDTWSHVLVKKQTVYDLLKSLLRNHGDSAGSVIQRLFPNLNLPDIDPAIIDEMPASVEDLPDWLSERLQSQDGLVGEAKQKVDDLRAERAADQARYDAGIAANPQLEPLIEDTSAETATLRQKVQSDADAIMDGAVTLAAADAGLKLVAAAWLNDEDDAMNVALTKNTAYVIHVLNNEPVSICVTSGGEEPPVQDVDKTALNRAINAAKSVDTSRYTDESVAAMQQALAEAEAVKANADATQSEVDAAAQALNAAIASLVEKETPPAVNKTALQKAISDAEAVDTTKYTDESVAAMNAALDTAKSVNGNPDATQARVDEVTAALVAAIENLVEKTAEIDKSALEAAIASAESVDRSKYTPESLSAMDSKLNYARTVLNDSDATQADVDNAVAALNSAIAALVEKPEQTVDKTALNNAITAAEAVDTTKYTDESVAAMNAALDTAKSVNGNPDATQARVDEVTAALVAAIENLVEKTAEIDKSALEAAIASAESVDRSKYTSESLSAMDSKLNYARTVLNDSDATQADVDNAAAALNGAIAALVEKPEQTVDKTALNNAITAAEAVDTTQFTDASVAAMQQALNAAKTVRDNPNATQAQVDSAAATLNSAVRALQPKPSSGVDKSALEQAIAAAEAIDRSKYTDESLAALDRQLASAKSTLANDNASQTTVNLAARRLNNAIAALVEKTPVQPTRFVDVPESAYYADAVDWAVANGITTGMDDTHFAPKSDCTRAQMVTFLWRTMGKPEPTLTVSPFDDVQNPSAYYYKAVLWAVENEITNGTDKTHFSPNATVTRAQVVTFLWRMEGETMPQSSVSPFVDVKDSSAYYFYAVLWAVENEITNGTDADHFSPKANCTRAQIVTFLYRDRVGA